MRLWLVQSDRRVLGLADQRPLGVATTTLQAPAVWFVHHGVTLGVAQIRWRVLVCGVQGLLWFDVTLVLSVGEFSFLLEFTSQFFQFRRVFLSLQVKILAGETERLFKGLSGCQFISECRLQLFELCRVFLEAAFKVFLFCRSASACCCRALGSSRTARVTVRALLFALVPVVRVPGEIDAG